MESVNPLKYKMNLKGQEKYNSIFDCTNSVEKEIKEINRMLKKLDLEIIQKTKEYNDLICKRVKLIDKHKLEDAQN